MVYMCRECDKTSSNWGSGVSLSQGTFEGLFSFVPSVG